MVSKLLVHLCQLSVEKRLAYLQDVKTGIDCIARLKKEELEICTNKTRFQYFLVSYFGRTG